MQGRLNNKSTVLISETLARKYFNYTDVSGRQITQLFNGHPRDYTIGGVFADQPMNSSFVFDAIVPWSNYSDVAGDNHHIEKSWSDLTSLRSICNLFIRWPRVFTKTHG